MNVNSSELASSAQSVGECLVRQIRFPTIAQGVIETAVVALVFLSAGYVSLGEGIGVLLSPMVPVVFVIMACNVASGVYRKEIRNCITNMYVHSSYGFVLSVVAFVATLWVVEPAYLTAKFVFFFLFFGFFVTNTVRSLTSGTDFMDGGGRRGN